MLFRSSPHVGIGGQTAHGGFGLASRAWGLTLDRVSAMDVVLANGTIVKNLTASSHPDLFWVRPFHSLCQLSPARILTTFAGPTRCCPLLRHRNLLHAPHLSPPQAPHDLLLLLPLFRAHLPDLRRHPLGRPVVRSNRSLQAESLDDRQLVWRSRG